MKHDNISQMNLPSTLFPSIDLTYIEDKYSGLSAQALFDAFSSLRGIRRSSNQKNYDETKVSGKFLSKHGCAAK